MNRRTLMISSLGLGVAAALPYVAGAAASTDADLGQHGEKADDRRYMVDLLEKIARPVLEPMSRGRLQAGWTPELSPIWDGRNPKVAYLEAFGRLASGISPWLALPDTADAEGQLRAQLRQLLLAAFAHSVDPASGDEVLWEGEAQVLVDAAFYANTFLRAPALWTALDSRTRQRIVARLQGVRRISPLYTNWLLFSAMIEAFLLCVDAQWDGMRLELAVRKVNEWYVGDGWYSDGPQFHFDHYGAYVIHPMLTEILEVAVPRQDQFVHYDTFPTEDLLPQAFRRMQRYGQQLERLISPEGSFPAIGRSMTYRTATFQPLGLLAWRKKLPESLSEGAVRAALTAVQRRTFDMQGTFDSDGHLSLGFAGHQPGMADEYSNAGSTYLAAQSFIALGLPATDSYWTAPAEAWTSRLAYAGKPFPRDHPIAD